MGISRTQHQTQTVTIANAGTTSGVVKNLGASMIGLLFPTMTGATVGFTVCATEDGTFVALNDNDGAALAITVVDGQAHTAPVELMPWPYFKIVSAGAEAAERGITVVSKG